MQSISNILLSRYKDYSADPKKAEELFKARGIEYNKRWNKAVGHFQERINKDRVKEGYKPLPFIVYRQKLIALKEFEDLRWYWFYCSKVSSIKDLKGNPKYTFGQIFFSSLKIK